MMRTALSRFRLALPIMAGFRHVARGRASGAGAREPSAAGLWQKIEDGKPVVWVLVIDHHDGIFEGVIAKTFPVPGEDPNEIDLLEMHRRSQEHAGARNFLYPRT